MYKSNRKIIISLSCMLLLVSQIAFAVQSVQLPDGTYVTIRPGESPLQAYTRAVDMYPEAFGNVKVPKQKIMDLDWYNECKLKAATTSSASIQAAVQACEYKAVPKKCRIHNVNKDALGNEKADLRIQCVEECSKANYYSKTLGECSRG
jgi:hypothetical protein